MFVFMSFLYFRLYFRCILAFFVFVRAAVYGVIKNNNNNNSNYAHQAVGQGCGSDLAGGRLEARAGRPNGMVTRTPVKYQSPTIWHKHKVKKT